MSHFNVLKHELVPEHHLIAEKDEELVLKKLKITKEQLPKIRKVDPVIATLETIHGEIGAGRVIKILRKSATAGVSEAFRVVTEG